MQIIVLEKKRKGSRELVQWFGPHSDPTQRSWGVEGRHQPACCWASDAGPRPCAGPGPAARERGARVHSRPWFTAGPVDHWLGFGEPDPLSLPPSSVHGAPGAARAPSPSFPLLSLCSTAPKGTQHSGGTPAPAFFGPCPLLPPLLSARCVPGRGAGARGWFGSLYRCATAVTACLPGCSCP